MEDMNGLTSRSPEFAELASLIRSQTSVALISFITRLIDIKDTSFQNEYFGTKDLTKELNIIGQHLVCHGEFLSNQFSKQQLGQLDVFLQMNTNNVSVKF